MKKTLLSIGLLFTSILLAQTDVKLNIEHVYDNAPFSFNTTLSSPTSEEFAITRLEYYITGVKLTHDGGQVMDVADAAILVNAENNTEVTLGNFAITNLESIEFGIGVTSDKNHLDPSTYSSGHALAPQLNSMHWGWSSGYRFIAYEGECGPGMGSMYQFHALGDDNYHTQTVSTSGIVNGSELIIALKADYLSALTNISVEDGPIKHGENYAECVSLIDNFKTSVFAENPDYSVSVNELDQITVSKLYPNPTNQSINLSTSGSSSKDLNYIITNVLGHHIETATFVSDQPISVDQLNNGLYFIELYDGNNQVNRQSFIVNK